MAITPKYLWPLPDPPDAPNVPYDMAALGNAIESTLYSKRVHYSAGTELVLGVWLGTITTTSGGASQALDLAQGLTFTGTVVWAAALRIGNPKTLQISLITGDIKAAVFQCRDETGATYVSASLPNTTILYAASPAAATALPAGA